MDEDFDPRFVDIITAAVAIINAQAGLNIAEQIFGAHERVNLRRDHRGAAHTAADEHSSTKNAIALDEFNANIMQAHCRAILFRRDHSNLKLTWQVAEFRMKTAPLTQQFSPWTRIGDFVCGGPCILVRTDIADAIAARLDRVHFHASKVSEQIGAFFQLDPIILDILARGEMAVIAVIFTRDVGEHVHLFAVHRAVRDSDAQHVRVKLKIKAVHKPQRLKLILSDFTREASLHLVAEILDACVNDGLVKLIILIHIKSPNCRCADRLALVRGRGGRLARVRGRGL